MQPQEIRPEESTVLRPTRLIKHPHHFLKTQQQDRYYEQVQGDIEQQPTHVLPIVEMSSGREGSSFDEDPDADLLPDLLDVGSMSTLRLMEFSNKLRVVRPPEAQKWPNGGNVITAPARTESGALAIPQTGEWASTAYLTPEMRSSVPTPVHGSAMTPFPEMRAFGPAPQTGPLSRVHIASTSTRQARGGLLRHPLVKSLLGLAVGILIILLLSRLIDFNATRQVLEDHLTTPEGIFHAALGSLGIALAFTLRGVRWKLFVSRISNISILKVIRIYWIAVFINFLLPVQGGEVAKSLMLKRVAGIPVSQSLPTVAMDKALDLMPVLGLIVLVPFIPGIHMNVTLWLILGLVGMIFIALVIIVALTVWKRAVAISLIHFFMKMLPQGIGTKIEGFGMGFVDSLIEGARRPKSFIPAIVLTSLAILCEGFYALQECQAVGLNTIGLGTAVFGYTMFTMFSILPTPPGQVGINEGAKVIVFSSLLGFSKDKVLAMSILSHLVGPAVMTFACLISLWSLGLTFSSVLTIKGNYHDEHGTKPQEQQTPVRSELLV